MSAGGNRTDEALMTAYAAGDASSFEELFGRHRRPLFTYLLHSTGERQVAEDLFQEIFLRLIRGRLRYRPSGRFRTWLFTIAHNVLTDDRRRTGLRGVSQDEDDMREDDSRSTAESGGADPVSTSHSSELGQRIERALLRIPADQREVFLLRERSGFDFARIAEVTDSGLATVKSRMRYALANLRRRLEEDLPSLSECLHE